MATQARAATVAGSVEEQAGELRYVARQPILDLHGKAHGYELLFWNGPRRRSGRMRETRRPGLIQEICKHTIYLIREWLM